MGQIKIYLIQKKVLVWNKKKPLKIVTHHWSNNINKGFDIYKYLDDLLDDKTWKKRIKFTYVGNIPKNFKFRNTNLIEPQKDNELSVDFEKSIIFILQHQLMNRVETIKMKGECVDYHCYIEILDVCKNTVKVLE